MSGPVIFALCGLALFVGVLVGIWLRERAKPYDEFRGEYGDEL